ncbi:MAG: hypothetical protein QM765_31610 [Myxococcales bacterium]
MRVAVYVLGGIATFLGLGAGALIVMLGLTVLYGSPWWAQLLAGIPGLLHLAWPVAGILLAKKGRPGWGLAMVLTSLPLSLLLLVGLPTMIGAAAQP